jgi:hypothetical protein
VIDVKLDDHFTYHKTNITRTAEHTTAAWQAVPLWVFQQVVLESVTRVASPYRAILIENDLRPVLSAHGIDEIVSGAFRLGKGHVRIVPTVDMQNRRIRIGCRSPATKALSAARRTCGNWRKACDNVGVVADYAPGHKAPLGVPPEVHTIFIDLPGFDRLQHEIEDEIIIKAKVRPTRRAPVRIRLYHDIRERSLASELTNIRARILAFGIHSEAMYVEDKPTAAVLTAVGDRHREGEPITPDGTIGGWTRIADTACNSSLSTVAIVTIIAAIASSQQSDTAE